MDKALSFFRVFDLAFFAPGVVVALALWHCDWLPAEFVVAARQGITTGTGLMAVLAGVAMTFILGLLCHAILRLVGCVVDKCCPNLLGPLKLKKSSDASQSAPESASKRWYFSLPETARTDLALYFWYLRSTCWNLAAAIPIAIGFIWSELPDWRVFVAAVFVASLVYQGRDYDKAMRSAARGNAGR